MMQQLSYEFIQFLNEKVMLYLPTERVDVGDKINFRCPICGDSVKSHSKRRGWWYKNTASFYCWNQCGGMSGIKFLQAISGEAYADIKREYINLFIKNGCDTSLSSRYVVPSIEPSLLDIKPTLNPDLKMPISDKAKSYLKSRKVLDAPFLQEDFYSCFSKKNNDEYILIPWKVNGIDAYYQLNDFQRLHSMKYIFPKGLKKMIYGLDNIDICWPHIIVFEGVYDSLFVKNGIAVGTKTITDYQLKMIQERYPHHQICISFDNDKSGITSMVNILKKDINVNFFRWFNKNTIQKDINEYVLAKNDVNLFTNKCKLERMIFNKTQMKFWLIENHLWSNTANEITHNPIAASINDLVSKKAFLI